MAKILLVDDHPDTCDAMARLLTAAKHEVHCVPNGKEALIEVMQNVPDVVLLDLMMPEMDGPSFLEVVRSYLRLQSLPVVVLTAFTESPMVERARNLNVNSILAKGKATTEDIQKALDRATLAQSVKNLRLGLNALQHKHDAWMNAAENQRRHAVDDR